MFSTTPTVDRRQEAENHLRQLRAFTVSQSWTVVHEFVDRLSRKTADREQFQLMFRAPKRMAGWADGHARRMTIEPWQVS
jgi:hypothetical protein